MKAAIWHGKRDVRIESVPEPPPPPRGQVQVKVAWCGICGTDLHEYEGGPLYIPLERPHSLTGVQAPEIIGHEMSGEITAVGDGVECFAPGDLHRRLSHYWVRRMPLVPKRIDGPV